MMTNWSDTLPVIENFACVADTKVYATAPDDWYVGVCDVVDASGAIANGNYRAVNFAGAAAISAMTNALGDELRLYVFGGDGARFLIPPHHREAAEQVLAGLAAFVQRELALELRVGLFSVGDVHASGNEVRVALWQASKAVHYALFSGGGMEWAEDRLKAGMGKIEPAHGIKDPDLTGLSCQWGPIISSRGQILSLIVKRARGASDADFAETTALIVDTLEQAEALSPVPPSGPAVEWSGDGVSFQARIGRKDRPALWQKTATVAFAAFAWFVFKTGLRIGSFDPDRYRSEIAANTDFRKFDDGLLMTVDCPTETLQELQQILRQAQDRNIIRFGIHLQDSAMMTCVVPSLSSPAHMHFVDGAAGGYASAARQIRKDASADISPFQAPVAA